MCSPGQIPLETLSPKFQMLHNTVLCRLSYHIPHPAHISIDQDPGIQCLGEGSQHPHWNFLCVFSWTKAQHFFLIPNRATIIKYLLLAQSLFLNHSFLWNLNWVAVVQSVLTLSYGTYYYKLEFSTTTPSLQDLYTPPACFWFDHPIFSPPFLPFLSCKQSMGSQWL